MRLGEARTPAVVIDLAPLRRNIGRMHARVAKAGIALRPHMKTAKSARVAMLATAGQAGGIAVSTLAEADYFVGHGYRDITYAVCIAPDKVEEVAALQTRGARITLLTDSAEVVGMLVERAARVGTHLRVLVEIDCGGHRTGVAWDSDALMDIARAVHTADRLELAGVLTHGGHSYACHSVEELKKVAEAERHAVVRAAERLRTAKLPCPTVSAGSTPTAVHAESFAGLTEIRPGVFVFFDLAQHGRKCCRVDDIAISVLATVVSHRRENRRILVDAGGLALSKDTSANELLPDAGYGWVCDPVTTERIGDLRIARVDQEHGFVEGDSLPYGQLPIGSRVRILPNHACMTAAAHREYLVVDDDDEIIDTWDRANGW